LGPMIVQTSFSLSTAILTEASLSFLGLGTPPSIPSWGAMLSSSRRYVELDPWPAIFPGLAIMLLVLGFNLFGDGLRDVLDPWLSRPPRWCCSTTGCRVSTMPSRGSYLSSPPLAKARSRCDSC